MDEPQCRPPERRSWIWLAPAAALLLFANGATTVPLAAWLGPAFLLRFVRSQSPRVGVPVAYILLITVFAVVDPGKPPIPRDVEVILVEYDEAKKVFIVVPSDL